MNYQRSAKQFSGIGEILKLIFPKTLTVKVNNFDNEKFVRAIKRKISDAGISAGAAAAAVGLHVSTFCRIINGKGRPKMKSILPICAWLGQPFESFTDAAAERISIYPNAGTLHLIEAAIFADATLNEADKIKLFEIFRAEYKTLAGLQTVNK